MTKSIFLAMFLFIPLLIFSSERRGESEEMRELRTELCKNILKRRWDNSGENLDKIIKTCRPDGSWSDVDYRNRSVNLWDPYRHLKRMLRMAFAYNKEGNKYYNDPELKKRIIKSLRFIVNSNVTCDNWWWREFGYPILLGETILLIYDDLIKVDLEKARPIMFCRHRSRHNGHNQISASIERVIAAAIYDKPDIIEQNMVKVAEVIKMAPEADDAIPESGDGIQADYSFHQHHKTLYSGTYGMNFILDCIFLASVLENSRFKFSREKKRMLESYVIDGLSWMFRNGCIDPGTLGRKISNKYASPLSYSRHAGSLGGFSLLNCCDLLAESASSPKRKNILNKFALRLRNGTNKSNALSGNRFFHKSDFMCQQRPKWYASARVASRRLYNTDYPCGGGEGLKSHYLADGANFIMRDGDEYFNIYGAWDWKKIPGTTVEYKEKPLTKAGVRRLGEKEFAGGVSDGVYGLCAMDFKRDKLRAKKAWFFFDDLYVCLGAGISCSSTNPVITTVNQCHFENPVKLSSKGEIQDLEPESEKELECDWVYHDDVGYYFSEKQSAKLSNTTRTGDWFDCNKGKFKESCVESVHIFSLWLEHGEKPNQSSYSYYVFPDCQPDEIKRFAANPRKKIKILANNPKLQAVENSAKKIVMAAFYHAGEFQRCDGIKVTSDQSCLLICSHKGEKLEFTISNPTLRSSEVKLTVNRHLSGENCAWDPKTEKTIIKCKLPDASQLSNSSKTFVFNVKQAY